MNFDASPLRMTAAALTTRPDAPWCLDLFCRAGGSGKGYWDAGFNVLGVDIEAQPGYPFWFVKSDALKFVREYGREFDMIHASPPCQDYSESTKQWRIAGYQYPDMIAATRAAIQRTGKPYVIENVPGAAHLLRDPLMLCGTMFDLYTTRHRYFENSIGLWFSPRGCAHRLKNAKMGRKPKRLQEYIQVMGHFSDVEYARFAMGISWMTQNELREAIPPAFTHYIGSQMMRAIRNSAP